MKFTVIGAGAIGGIMGAYLARAGHDVTLVDTVVEHLAAIRERGITLEGRSELTQRVAAAIQPNELRAPLGTVLCAVKTLHTAEALAPVAPLLGTDEYVASMQNGLAFNDVAAIVGSERTLAACFNFGGHYEGPGRILHGTTGGFAVGELDGQLTTRLRELRDALAAVQECEATDNILGCVWTKMAMASSFFATALVDADVADILANAKYQPLILDLIAETVAVAEARGVSLNDLHGFDPRVVRFGERSSSGSAHIIDVMRQYWLNGAQPRTGIWIDLAVRKRKSEAGPQLGGLMAAADGAGVPVPRNRAVYRMITEIEAGQRGFAWQNLDEVERQAAAAISEVRG
jgi:2-dehydropantoate 2-reductase